MERWVKYRISDDGNSYDADLQARFVDTLSPLEVVDAINLIAKILSDDISAIMLEGVSRLEVTQTSIEISLTCLRGEENIKKLEERHQLNEWSRHHVNYMFYLFREIDKHYPLDDKSIPYVFRKLGDMEYLRNR